MRHRVIAAVAVAAVVVSACGSESGTEPSPTATPPSATTANQTHAQKPVPAQLQFTANTADGQEFSGESLLGEPAVMWFWAPWCPTCQREAPMVGQIADANPPVKFVGVAAQDEVPAMQAFVDKYPVQGFTHLADTDGAVWAKFGVTQQPAYAFVDADGSIDVVKGSLSEPELTERVTELSNQ